MADKKLGSDLGGKLDGCLLGEASSPCLLCDVSVPRRRAMSLSSAFRAVGNDPGIITWRIEKMELALVPLNAHGNFYEGDCYIILSTRRVGSLLSQDIHFWIGKDSSQDEQSCAAIYTTQLDDYLGGSPVQHREVQYHESDTFRGYFKQGIM